MPVKLTCMQNKRKVYKAYMAVRIHARDVGMIMPAYDRSNRYACEGMFAGSSCDDKTDLHACMQKNSPCNRHSLEMSARTLVKAKQLYICVYAEV